MSNLISWQYLTFFLAENITSPTAGTQSSATLKSFGADRMWSLQKERIVSDLVLHCTAGANIPEFSLYVGTSHSGYMLNSPVVNTVLWMWSVVVEISFWKIQKVGFAGESIHMWIDSRFYILNTLHIISASWTCFQSFK